MSQRIRATHRSLRRAAAMLLVCAALTAPLRAVADSTGEQSPTTTTPASGSFTTPSNAFVCDNTNLAQAQGNNQTQIYSVYGLSIPPTAIVTGIQVRVRGNDGSSNNRRFTVQLSPDGGSTYFPSVPLRTSNFKRNKPLKSYILGGSAYLWGRAAWSASELSNANFRVKVVAAKGSTGDPANLDCIPVTVFYDIPGAPNLNLSKTDNPDPVQPLQNITYTISYSNTGESTATNVIITDATPANTTFVSASPAPTGAPSVGGTGTVTWNVGSVPVGGSGVVTLVVKVNSGLTNGTQINNTNYTVASDQNPPTVGDPVTTTVQGTINLTLGKTDMPDPVASAGTLTYVLTIGNTGNVPSTNIVVNEQYDPNINFVSFTSTCNLANNGGPDQWSINSLAAGASCTITITTTVDSGLDDGVLLNNIADIVDDALNSAEATAVTTVDNPAACGDGVVKAPEQCDQGAANGTPGSCCTATCTLRSSGDVCRASAGVCDVAETCDGSNPTCPANAFVSAGTPCTDDGNVCTDDACNGTGTCAHTANAAPCDDGSACTTNDTCSGGSCVGGPAPNCNDSNVCTDDSCNPATGCVHTNNSAPCDDGSACTTNDTCSGGSCVGGPAPNCNDSNVCTDDSCNPATGCVHTNNSAPCDDGDACTTNDTCSGGSCAPGPPANCNDGNACTTDSCVSPTGCQHAAVPSCCNTNADCADTDMCTTNERCVNHACVSDPVNCDDSNVCTDDSCNPTMGCVHANNSAPCSDGSACTTNDTCAGGSCVGGPPPNCNDNNVCTDDSCNPATGCVNTNNTAPCDDGDACTTNDACAGGSCVGGSPPNCNDNNVCTDDSCDSGSGCVHTNNANPCEDGDACTTNDMCSGGTCVGGTAPNCDDSNGCTDDSCNTVTGCVHTNNSAPCSDGDACTTTDTCSGGACGSGPPLDCDDHNGCTDDSCNPVSGCTHVNNSGSCDDGNACTTEDACTGGVCVGGPAPNCNDGNVCTDDSCDPGTGCVYTNNTASCSDGDACTTNDTCNGGSCVGGPPANCDDSNGCTTDSCVSPTGCHHASIPGCCSVDGDCTDSDLCTTNERCVMHACVSDPVNCSDNNPCTDDSCNPATGCAHVFNNAPCSDGSACSTGDTCQGGLCVGGPAPNCNDNNICTDDACDTGTGCTHNNNTAPCDDGSFCTTNDACSGGGCVGGPAPNCDDNNVCTNDSCVPASGCTHPAGNAGAICRVQDGVCDVAETCTGTSAACPADAFAAASVICRAAAGECDTAENCTGSGPDCPENMFQPNGTSCPDDGVFCDGMEACQNGACQSSGAACPNGQSCDEATDTCFQGGCPDNAVACRTAHKALLLISDRTDPSQDKLIWKWIKGATTTQAEFADPTNNAHYALCFYDGPNAALIGQANVSPGPLWSAVGSKGYKYKDTQGSADGIQKILLKGSSSQNKSKALVKGAGGSLPVVALPIAPGDLPLVVQLRDNHSGVCWEGSFATPKKNRTGQFKAKTTVP